MGSDNKIEVDIDLKNTGTPETKASAEAIKQVADESRQYEEALRQMALKDEAAKDGTTDLNQAVREYAEEVKAAREEMDKTGGAFIPDDMAGKIKEVGKAEEESGENASDAAGKHLALRRIMGELNRISPGLGEALHLVSEAYMQAGEAAEGGAVGVAEFGAAMDELLVSLGPLIIAMLSIEAAMQFWDSYKDGVMGVANAFLHADGVFVKPLLGDVGRAFARD